MFRGLERIQMPERSGPRLTITRLRRKHLLMVVGVVFIGLLATLIAVATIGEDGSDEPPIAGPLQMMINAAAPGDVVDVPAGIYRETVVIDKPLALRGEAGAEIRGSDVWDGGWELRDGLWYRGELRDFSLSDEPCRESSNGRCNWPAQVFLNGEPLLQVEGDPESGEFTVNAEREVVIADDPAGQLLEVTVRDSWIIARSDDVTIEGFTMRHAAAHPHAGGIDVGGYGDWTVRDNVLTQAHGAAISMRESRGHRVTGNEVSENGRLGLHLWIVGDVEIEGNYIWGNNTEEFEPSWEAGGIKLGTGQNVEIVGNEVFDNDGPGIWADVDSLDVDIAGNRVYGNERAGIVYELSFNGEIHDNVVYENGYGFASWGFGAGILVQNSSDVEVYDNTVAWNADGITVISQERGEGRWNTVAGNNVHGNAIIAGHDGSSDAYGLAWLQDWDGTLGDVASNNQGSGNSFWYDDPEGAELRFKWVSDDYWTAPAFSASPGGRDSRNLTEAEKDEILAAAGL